MGMTVSPIFVLPASVAVIVAKRRDTTIQRDRGAWADRGIGALLSAAVRPECVAEIIAW